jgi:hypothetical protein
VIVRSLGVICALALMVAGCGGSHASTSSAPRSPALTIPQLTSIDQLRAVFNAHPGQPRLIVLISPT